MIPLSNASTGHALLGLAGSGSYASQHLWAEVKFVLGDYPSGYIDSVMPPSRQFLESRCLSFFEKIVRAFNGM